MIRQTAPTIIRDSSGAVKSVARSPDTATSGPSRRRRQRPALRCLASRSPASALQLLRCGRRLPASAATRAGSCACTRRSSAPMPPRTNMARQPNSGTTRDSDQQRDRQAGHDADRHQAEPFAARFCRHEFGHGRIADNVFGAQAQNPSQSGRRSARSCSGRTPPPARRGRKPGD